MLVDVLRCGICGSDLHARHHADQQADVLAEAGYDGFMRSDQQVVFGHELCGEVAGYGPGCSRKAPVGTPVVALPLIRRGEGVHAIGLSAAAPGAYAEQVVVEESLMFGVPNGLSPDLSVVTEPLAVGWHAVRRAEIKKRDVAIVIGCGPVGLAVIAMLKARGVRTIVASAPLFARVIVVGVCMEPDRIRPAMAINKEIDLRFVVGYTPLEFRDTLRMLAEGEVNAAPIVTGTVGLPGVERAFAALGDPETHAKILIDPGRSGEQVATVGAGR